MKMTFIQDLFNNDGIISAPVVIGVVLCFFGLLMALLSPWVNYHEIYPTILNVGLAASGFGIGEKLVGKHLDKKNEA